MITYEKRLIDTTEVLRALQVLLAPGHVAELRILNATTRASRYPYQASGYFNDQQAMIEALKTLTSAKGVYVTLQPCIPELLARAQNRLRSADEMRMNKSSTSDSHVLAYRWLLIDADPDRPADISASDQEHEAAIAHAESIQQRLHAMGWPAPIVADSGNGAHLLYRIDLGVARKDLVQRVLGGLADAFDSEGVHIDQTVFNPSRISKLYGTLACKGDDTHERPHRMARLLAVPEEIHPVSQDLLEAIARQPIPPKAEPRRQISRRGTPPAFDLAAWIAANHLDVQGPKPWNNGMRWIFNVCPWNADHTDRSAYIVQFENGAIAAGCQHNSCREKTWQDLRRLYPLAANANGSASPPLPPRSVTGSAPSPDSLPEIIIGEDQLRDMTNQALAAIQQQEKRAPSLFLQAARLVSVGHDEDHRPIIGQMGIPEVREVLTHAANFYRLKKVAGAEELYTKAPCPPPKEIAEQILARQIRKPHLPFPALMAIVEVPVIRPDGSILDKPGYDRTTRLYYAPSKDMPKITVPMSPTREEREAALACIWDAIGEFAYASEADKANALGLLLTPIARPAIQRHIPLALLDAPKRGTGKGLLSDVASIIATGSSSSVLTMSENPDELQKSITALLIEGATVITIDNIVERLQSKHLDAVLTADWWKGRILGVSKMARVPQRATWIATGNNIRLGGDLTRRCYRIRMNARSSKPHKRKNFTHKDLAGWVKEHRVELVKALLTLARAWYAAGQPRYEHLPSMGTFTGWVETIGGILEYAGVQGFLTNMDELDEQADEDGRQWEAFLQAWRCEVGEEWVPLSTIIKAIQQSAGTAGGVSDVAGGVSENTQNSLGEVLPDTLQVALKEKPATFSVRLGKALDKRIDACFGDENLCLEKMLDTHHKKSLWRVFAGGAGGSSLPSPGENCETPDSLRGESEKRKNGSGSDGTHPPHPPQIAENETVQKSENGSTSDSIEIATSEDGKKKPQKPQIGMQPPANGKEWEDFDL
ncbi:hypothetical protein [Dictyobacter formicarum]|uniref:Uncharacterized protein n=1 Tax=Dictyobacter formicarum TaxID=2778368 RepID=A0ABQ3VA12_9CHLR|nr:hypothetical protein [Dictyobacter formicarum]GHO82982.1 hypothetical protein KSZ_09880 [Dictyobacter formicarum]